MPQPETVDPLTSEHRAFRDELIDRGWLLPSRAGILPGLGSPALAVYEGLLALIRRTARELYASEIVPVRFPPVFGVRVLEKTGYVASFPQLLGAVDSFVGGQREFRELIAEFDNGGDWRSRLGSTDFALVSAACHALFAHLEGSTAVPGVLYELTGDCFRHEPSEDPMRLVAFRMHEYVRIGTAATAKDHQREWLQLHQELYASLDLPVVVVPANDAFFGRGGVVLAANQIESEAKFEVVTEVYEGSQTAIASANVHGEHFGDDFSISLPDGSVAQSACTGFGMERIVLALARRHGRDLAEWPTTVRARLGLS